MRKPLEIGTGDIPMPQQETKASVSEDKFNGTATFTVQGVEDKREAKIAARRYWKEEYDHSPSKVVAEESHESPLDEHRTFTVVVAQHSSGSLKGSKTFDL